MKELIINASESIDSDEVFKDILSLSIKKEEEQFLSDNRPINEESNQDFFIEEAWIQTFSGKKFYPFNPNINDIDIYDIAHSLSNMCRFIGHCDKFYSVAQHSVIVSYIAKNNFAALMHDASEYVLSDISSPLKKTGVFSQYREYERKLQALIYKKYRLPKDESPDVKKADLIVLSAEMRDLINNLHKDITIIDNLPKLPFKIIPLPPEEAKKLFLDRFHELYET